MTYRITRQYSASETLFYASFSNWCWLIHIDIIMETSIIKWFFLTNVDLNEKNTEWQKWLETGLNYLSLVNVKYLIDCKTSYKK